MAVLSDGDPREAYGPRPVRERVARLALAPDGRPRPDAPFGRGPVAARVLGRVIRAASAAGGRLPTDVAHGLAAAGGTLEWAARSGKRAVLAENLSHAVGLPADDPAVRALVRREVVNEARRSADLLFAMAFPERALAQFRVRQPEHLLDALALGRGVVLAGPHIGGWEVVTSAPAALLGRPFTAVVRDDWLAWAVAGIRRAMGLQLSFLGEPVTALAERLQRGEVVLLFGDIVLDGMRTHRVRFLDAYADLAAGPAALSRLTGAPIVPLAVLPIAPRCWEIRLQEPIPAPRREERRSGERRALQALADAWSATIRAHPEHWAAVYPLAWHDGPAAAGA